MTNKTRVAVLFGGASSEHEVSRRSAFAIMSNLDPEKYDLIPKISRDAPPVFIAATAEDVLTGFAALAIANAYKQLRRHYELHVFQYGPHGYSLANEVTADGSSQMLEPAFAQWQELSVQWLHKTFGKPTFVDKSTSKMMQILKEKGYVQSNEETLAGHLSKELKGTDFA